MMYFRIGCIALLMVLCGTLTGQIHGVVIDESGEPLPYVSIYVQNTSTGTTSNAQGAYTLLLSPGSYNVAYRYIGYKTEMRSIEVADGIVELDIVLTQQATMLSEVLIAADAEDPAYAVIRQAIKKRPYYHNYWASYSCDVYVKGNQKVKDVPTQFMGQEIGDLDGALDSTRQGIVYLSESVSRLYVKGNKHKEVVKSSKISGNDRGYSFNSAKEMEFDFLKNTITLERQMVTPLADNALQYYRYQLLGTYYDQNGKLINEIAVIPKRRTDPVFNGKIYIAEDEWSVQALNLSVTGAASKVYILDSLNFNQVFIPMEGTDGYALFSNTISFGVSLFGVKLQGLFVGVYSNYDMEATFEEGFFDSYIHIVEAQSNVEDSTFWDAVRPLPLTIEEERDYIKRDSISLARRAPEYLDSMDRKDNRFRAGNLINGYFWRNRQSHAYVEVNSPLSSIGFNTVQGFNTHLDIDVRKYYDEEETQRLLWGADVSYGFSEKKARATAYINWRPSRLNRTQFSLSGGSALLQYNRQEPISPLVNGLYSLLLKDNFAKYFDIKSMRARISHEPWVGITLYHNLSWEARQPITNHTDFSIFSKEETYTSNNPRALDNDLHAFDRHQALLYSLVVNIRFNQKYVLFPDRRLDGGSTGPLIQMGYTGAYAIGGTDIAYHKIAMSASDEWELGVGGRLQWYVNGGTFIGDSRIEFVDYQHFMGNQIFFTKTSDYRRSFLNLPYYDLSTRDTYGQLHIQHHFDGWLLDKLPGINTLGWSAVAGFKHLRTTGNAPFTELHIGLDNIGWSFVRLVRLDGVMSWYDGHISYGARMSLGF